MADSRSPGAVNRPPGGALAVAAAIVAFGFIGSRLLGVVRTVAIADAFGAAPELDAWRVAFQIPDVIFQVLAGATMGSAFIPVFARLSKQDGEARAWRLASAVLTTVTAATALLCLIGFIFAPLLVPILAPGLGEDIGRRDELVSEAVSLTRLMLLSPLLFSMSGMVTGILNARQQFLLPAIAPMLYNLAIIAGATLLAEPFGVRGLSYGVIGGAALHLAIQVPGLVRLRMQFRPRFDWADSATREVARLMGPRIIGLGAVQANLFVTIFFASNVASGAINVMNYAFIISQLPLGIFGMALATAAFPRLADQVAEGDLGGLQETVSRVLRMILFLTIPTAIGLALLREPVTVLLLQGGAFTSADSVLVATALGWYCLGIVPQAGVEIHSRGFYALGDTRTPVAMTVLSLATNIVLAALLWERFEYAGLAFAVSVAAWAEWGLLYVLYARRTGSSPAPDLRVAARMAIAAGVMAVGVAVAASVFATGDRLEALVATVGLGVFGAGVYAAVVLNIGGPEVRDAVDRLVALARRRGKEGAEAIADET